MLLRCEGLDPPMSQLGHSRRFSDVLGMSASPPTPAVLPHCREPTRCANNGHAAWRSYRRRAPTFRMGHARMPRPLVRSTDIRWGEAVVPAKGMIEGR